MSACKNVKRVEKKLTEAEKRDVLETVISRLDAYQRSGIDLKLNQRQVMVYAGIEGRSTLAKLEDRGEIPKRRKNSAGGVYWLCSDLVVRVGVVS